MTVASSMFAAFNSLQSKFDEAGLSSGTVKRPPDGIHDCIVLGMTIEDGKFRLNDQGLDTPSKSITFRYQLCNDPESPGKPLEFPGATFQIPLATDESTWPEGKKTQAKIERARLNNHLFILNGEMPTNLAAALTSAYNKISGSTGAVVAAKVNCQTSLPRPGQTRTFFKEFLTQLLSK